MKREPFSIQDAWQAVGDLYATLVTLFGNPFEIAEQLILMSKERRDILSWLGPLEALARRILLLRALHAEIECPATESPARTRHHRLR